jgi:hypothetical protein
LTRAGSTLSIISRKKLKTLSLSNGEQGAYIRAICLIADQVVQNALLTGVNARIIENDLYTLRAVHNVAGLTSREVRIVSVTVTAPGKTVDGRVGVEIDFDDIKRQVESEFPSGGDILAYDLTVSIEVDNRQLKWLFPSLAVPIGEKRMFEGDPEFEPYLTVG